MRFRCKPGCIRCCEQPGEVYLTREDIARLAAYLGLTRTQFRRRYLRGAPPLMRLRIPRGLQCPFLLPDGCSVHPVKPLQCSAFPFWPELLSSRAELDQAAQYCPGLHHGPLVKLTLARQIARQVEQAFPGFYPPPE
jgi:Fe-S-cluster containining protein